MMNNCKYKFVVLSILFTSNNIISSVTSVTGDVLFWTSAGSKKNKGSKKTNTVYLIPSLKSIKSFIDSSNYEFVFLKIKGFNKNKKFALKSLKYLFPKVFIISEKTPHPHNGCKQPKKRRV
uniref:ribosomal protein S11 n=1 Tax=Catenella fusiformis TaxID=3024791 RepID=UPI00300171FE|nr:ribosomal protein S11 [Catenella fusiformis]